MKVITIDREFGAGGHSVGRAVAARLGLEIYDKDIIAEAARESGIASEEMAKEEERLSSGASFINHIIPVSYDVKDVVFEAESKVILDLAAKGPCIILGRCGNAILQDAGVEALDVFLYAEREARVKRAGELLGLEDEDDILTAIKKKDKERRGYYEYYTDHVWGACEEYDLCLNTGYFSFEQCVDMICAAAQA